MESKQELTVKLNPTEKIFIAFIGGIPFFLFLFFSIFYYSFSGMTFDQSSLGQLGDFYGGLLNPIIAYVALITIVITLINNKNTLHQAVLSARDAQLEHTQTITQALAITLLNAFSEASQRARSRIDSQSKNALINILQHIETGNNQEILKSEPILYKEWGGAARCLHLLLAISDSNPFLNAIYDAALATLEPQERNYTLLCLVSYKPELVQRIVEIECKNITESVVKALYKIAELNKNQGIKNERY